MSSKLNSLSLITYLRFLGLQTASKRPPNGFQAASKWPQMTSDELSGLNNQGCFQTRKIGSPTSTPILVLVSPIHLKIEPN